MKSKLDWKNIIESSEFGDHPTYEKNNLGAVYSKEKTKFHVWAPTADKVEVKLYATGSDAEEGAGLLEILPMAADSQMVYTAVKSGDCHGIYYTFEVTVDGITRETGDIYAKACGVNGARSMVVDLDRTNPDGWDKDDHVVYPLEDTQIWEVHIGDFSNDSNAGVKQEHRGKYLAFTEENTFVPGKPNQATCVAYLKELGITHVHLLPSFDFGSTDESLAESQFNWGYDPMNYNVPEGSYSTDAFHGEVRIKEYKAMVQALHKVGISVVMDVVYNHTFALDSHFQKTVPYYYYRQWENGETSNGSACGNDTASDRKMFANYMIESVVYWVNEYHVDGFRFDLMGLHDVAVMNDIRAALDVCCPQGKELLVYGEPWSASGSPLSDGHHFAKKDSIDTLDSRILMFNDDVRDWIKGSYSKLEESGFANGKSMAKEDIIRSQKGLFSVQWAQQPKSPGEIIRYVSAHDNSTLWDKLIDSVKKNQDYETHYPEIEAMNKLAAAMVQLGKGVPFMQAGEEAGRTKQGEDNSFNLSKELNQLDWKRIHEFHALRQYYMGLMAVRNSRKEISDLSSESLTDMQFLQELPEQVVAYILKKQVLIVFNASEKPVTIALDTECEWTVLVNKEIANPKGMQKVKGCYCIQEVSCAVLCRS